MISLLRRVAKNLACVSNLGIFLVIIVGIRAFSWMKESLVYWVSKMRARKISIAQKTPNELSRSKNFSFLSYADKKQQPSSPTGFKVGRSECHSGKCSVKFSRGASSTVEHCFSKLFSSGDVLSQCMERRT